MPPSNFIEHPLFQYAISIELTTISENMSDVIYQSNLVHLTLDQGCSQDFSVGGEVSVLRRF